MDRAYKLTEAILDPIPAALYWPAAHQAAPLRPDIRQNLTTCQTYLTENCLRPKGASTYVHTISSSFHNLRMDQFNGGGSL